MIQITSNGVSIDGSDIPLYSGAVHYWRISVEHWGAVLDRIKEMGFEIVETYIPWSVHEYEAGRYDFGEGVPEKNLDQFLSMCEERGLKILVRPGPHINAEMTYFGFPEWILMDEEIQARSPMGTAVVYPFVSRPFPIPSYASKKLFTKFEEYYNQILPILKKHDYPKGSIIGIQADNELCYFFRDSAYTLDYSDAAIEQYHEMLTQKYETISRLNGIYFTTHTEFKEIQPPMQFDGQKKEDLPYFLDWAEYKEYQILKGLEFFVHLIKKSGMNTFVFHNCAYQNYSPISLQRSERIPGMDLVGIDAYPEKGDSTILKERIRYMAGGSVLPYVPEFGSGSWFDRGDALDADQEEYGYLYAFMNGMKAVNFYMLVERDRWFACPLTNSGERREPYFTMFRKLVNMLYISGLAKYQRKPDVLILKNYGMGRLKKIYSLFDANLLQSNCLIQGQEFPRELFIPDVDLGITIDKDDSHWSKEEWIQMVYEYLQQNGIDYNISDQYISEETLMQYPIIFASMYDFMEEKEAARLTMYVKSGGTLIIGPKLPEYNEKFQRCTIDTSLWNRMDNTNSLDSFFSKQRQPYKVLDSEVEIMIHHGVQDDILFMANTSASRKSVTLYMENETEFSGVWKAYDYSACKELRVDMEAYTVCIWKVVTCLR